jgi:hypothetical protein
MYHNSENRELGAGPQVYDSKVGEMAEWSMAHAWKTNFSSNTEQPRDTLSRSR